MGLSLSLWLFTALYLCFSWFLLRVGSGRLADYLSCLKLVTSFFSGEAKGTIGRWVTNCSPCSCLCSCEHVRDSTIWNGLDRVFMAWWNYWWNFGLKAKQGQGNLGPSCRELQQGRAPEWGLWVWQMCWYSTNFLSDFNFHNVSIVMSLIYLCGLSEDSGK